MRTRYQSKATRTSRANRLAHQNSNYQQQTQWKPSSPSKPTAPPKKTKSQYKTGDQVKHTTFGTGTVISVKMLDNDEELTVAFPNKGIKRLLTNFAKLEKL